MMKRRCPDPSSRRPLSVLFIIVFIILETALWVFPPSHTRPGRPRHSFTFGEHGFERGRQQETAIDRHVVVVLYESVITPPGHGILHLLHAHLGLCHTRVGLGTKSWLSLLLVCRFSQYRLCQDRRIVDLSIAIVVVPAVVVVARVIHWCCLNFGRNHDFKFAQQGTDPGFFRFGLYTPIRCSFSKISTMGIS